MEESLLRARCRGDLGWGGSLGALEPEGGKGRATRWHVGGDSASRGEDRGAEERGAARDRLQPETCACEGAAGMKDVLGSESVCVSSGQTTPTQRCQAGRHCQGEWRKGQRAGSSYKSPAGPAYTPSTPPSPATPGTGGGGRAAGGLSLVLYHPPAIAGLGRNVLRLARRVHVTPRSAGSVPLYTSENH